MKKLCYLLILTLFSFCKNDIEEINEVNENSIKFELLNKKWYSNPRSGFDLFFFNNGKVHFFSGDFKVGEADWNWIEKNNIIYIENQTNFNFPSFFHLKDIKEDSFQSYISLRENPYKWDIRNKYSLIKPN